MTHHSQWVADLLILTAAAALALGALTIIERL